METLKKQAAKLLGEQKKYRRWLAVFLCLAIAVTAGTTAALKMNGQALSHEKKVLACGEKVHVHTAECYESGVIPASADGESAVDREQPICGYADYIVHTHDENCYDEDGELVCEMEEVLAHVHKESCFEKQMVLVCGKEETAAHQHAEDCRELICGQEESQAQAHQHTEDCKELICGIEEAEGHQHTDTCRTMVQGELICENTEEGHEHTAECHEQTETITCGLEETEGHTHTEECYGSYICVFDDSEEGHIHTEECYGSYTCGYEEETEGHIHTEACYQVKEVAICGELELHTHIREASEGQESCCDAEGNLICGIPELKEHQHTEECFEIIEVRDDEETKFFQKVYEDAEIRVTAEYRKDANIPEEAELVAERMEAEADAADESEEAAGESNEAADAQEPAETGDEADAQETDGGISEEEVTYRLKFLVDGAEIEPEDTVSFVAHGLDGEGNESDGLVTLVYKAGDGLDAMTITLTRTIAEDGGTEAARAESGIKVYEDAEIRVTAEYAEDANIPEEAELTVERMEIETADENTAGEDGAQEPEETGSEADTEGTRGVESGADTEGTRGVESGADTEGTRAAESDAAAEESRSVGDSAAAGESRSAEGSDAAEESQSGERGEASGQDTKAAVTLESVEKEVSYRLRFLVDGEETEPEGTVKFTAQALDEEGNEAGEPAELIYNAGDGLDTMVITLTREITIEVQHEFRQTAEVGNVRVIAEYDSEAKIPEEAQLQAALITEDGDPDSYGEFKAMYLEQAGENAVMDMLLEIGFCVGDEKVAAQAPVSIKVQIADTGYEADEKVNVFRISEAGMEEEKAALAAEEDGSRSMSFNADGLSTYMIGREDVSLRKECRNEALNIIVVAKYGPEAEIPEEAELKAEEITPETDPEHYAQREAEYLEQAGEGAIMDMLLNIGFYVDGVEVEPKASVSITIQMLDGQYEDGEQMNVVHFGDEATEKLDASDIRTDEEGNKVTSFETSSFSNYALGRNGSVLSLENGGSYQIYCESGNKNYALYHNENNEVKAVEVSVNEEGTVIVPDGYTQEGFIWGYENGYGTATLKYSSGNSTYYLWDDPFGSNTWGLTTSEFKVLQFSEDSNNGGISIFSAAGSSYLNCSGGQIVVGKTSDSTAWKFVRPTFGTYKVNYYKNEYSLDNNQFQAEPTNNTAKGTWLGSVELTPEETPDGKKVIRIPLTGRVGNDEIGVLPDYISGGNTFKFYGWSLHSNSNYQPDIGHLIYCGTPVQINGYTVPSYVADGAITLDVTSMAGEIDLYAIWAAPSHVEGSVGVEYYGTNYNKLSGFTDYERAGRGVMFFVRLDGQIPNEPGSLADTSPGGILNRANYTEYVFAKDESGQIVRQPLKYWMHIYGVQNGDAVEANLAYKPTDADLLERIKENNGSIKVAGKTVDFSRMTLEEFQRDYYVAWYVCKDGREKDCWHIDGVLLKKTEQWNLVYADNGVTGGTVIPGVQYAYRGNEGDSAMVHNSLIASGSELLQSDIPLEKTGYKFVGWNVSPNGGGTSFTAGTYNESGNGTGDADFTDNDIITVAIINPGTDDEKGQVYKNGVPVEGLYATKNANGVYEVILYPQWAKGTNLLTVTKTDLNGVKLSGAKFKLYKCDLTEGRLVKGQQLTTGDGSTTSEEGTLTIHNLENDTFYCLEESYAPNGYEQRNVIYFMVEVSEDNNKVMEIHIKDESGNDVAEADKPTWLTATYQPKDTSGTGGLANINFTIADEAILQEVSFKKTGADGITALAGAEFSLSKEVTDKNGESKYAVIGTSHSSDKDGMLNFYSKDDKEVETTLITTLPYGKYKLEETKAPNGYSKVTVYFEINDPDATKPEGYQKGMVVTGVEVEGKGAVDFDKGKYSVGFEEVNTSVDNNGDNIPATRYSYELTVANMPGKQTVVIKKLGNDGEKLPLPGAKFSLYEAKDDKVPLLKDIISDKDGMAELGELACGEYFLVEEEAPDGYILPTKPIKITVTSEGVVTDSGTFKSEETTDGKIKCVVPIYNSTGILLPETGGSGIMMYTLGGFAVIAASLMYGLSMRRKKEKGGCH